MSGSNFTDEIKQAMTPKSRAKPGGSNNKLPDSKEASSRNADRIGQRARPAGSQQRSAGSVQTMPPHGPHPYSDGTSAPGVAQQSGIAQANQVPAPGMHSTVPQHGGHDPLVAAHAQIVNALMSRQR